MILMFSGPLEFRPAFRGTSHSPSWARCLLCLSPDPPHTSRATPAVDTPAHTFKHFQHPLRHPSGLVVCPLSAGRPSSGRGPPGSGSGPWAVQVGSSGVPSTKQRSRMAEGVRESQVGPSTFGSVHSLYQGERADRTGASAWWDPGPTPPARVSAQFLAELDCGKDPRRCSKPGDS